jgi:hypothetical protein
MLKAPSNLYTVSGLPSRSLQVLSDGAAQPEPHNATEKVKRMVGHKTRITNWRCMLRAMSNSKLSLMSRTTAIGFLALLTLIIEYTVAERLCSNQFSSIRLVDQTDLHNINAPKQLHLAPATASRPPGPTQEADPMIPADPQTLWPRSSRTIESR